MTRRPGLIVATVGAVLAVVLFIVLSGGDGESSSSTAANEQSAPAGGYGSGTAAEQEPEPKPQPEEPEAAVIEIKGGEPVGGVSELEFAKGDEILIEVASDAAYEIHLHGYDISQDVPAGGTVEFRTPASIEGVFELEIEDTVTPIAEISVVPG